MYYSIPELSEDQNFKSIQEGEDALIELYETKTQLFDFAVGYNSEKKRFEVDTTLKVTETHPPFKAKAGLNQVHVYTIEEIEDVRQEERAQSSDLEGGF